MKSLFSDYLYNDEATVRVIERGGEPWFVAIDVCAVLEIKNARMATARLEDYERDDVSTTDAIGRQQIVTIVNEAGLYSLIFASRKPAAKEFKRWVTTEVLPSIRKYGFYDPTRLAEAETLLLDFENPHAGRAKTQSERLREEVARFEMSNNTSFYSVFERLIPRSSLKFFERGEDGAIPNLTKSDRWLYLLSNGFDLPYILWGQRTLTDTERRLRDLLRNGSEDARAALLATVARFETQPQLPAPSQEDDED